MAALVEAGQRREAVKRYVEQVLHPDGIDDLDAWLDEWPVWPDCVALAEEVVRMNRAVEQYRLPARLDVDAPAAVLAGTDGPDFLRRAHETFTTHCHRSVCSSSLEAANLRRRIHLN